MKNQQMEMVIFANNCNINIAMKAWLDHWHIVPYFKGIKHSLVSARNEAVRDFLKRDTEATHLIMMDNNVWPNCSTNAILAADGDAIYLGHITTSGTPAHFDCDTMGTACCRISRDALQKLAPPWFEYRYDVNGIEWTSCECYNFTRKLKVAGYTPEMVGVVPHLIEMISVMGPNGPKYTTKEKFINLFINGEQE